MNVDKSPGTDGFNAHFFQTHWQLIGKEVSQGNSSIFPFCILKELNHTFLTLVPKICSPSSLSDYRPIACCNVLYKTISKIISNRLQVVIDELVSINVHSSKVDTLVIILYWHMRLSDSSIRKWEEELASKLICKKPLITSTENFYISWCTVWAFLLSGSSGSRNAYPPLLFQSLFMVLHQAYSLVPEAFGKETLSHRTYLSWLWNLCPSSLTLQWLRV